MEYFQQIGTFDIVEDCIPEDEPKWRAYLSHIEEFNDEYDRLLNTTIEGSIEPNDDDIPDFHIMELPSPHQIDDDDDDESSTLLLKLQKLGFVPNQNSEERVGTNICPSNMSEVSRLKETVLNNKILTNEEFIQLCISKQDLRIRSML
jgi:hypothetical protein